eukprot:scaffold26966_cov201-Cylindrotheca_fusiformis.AAC.1
MPSALFVLVILPHPWTTKVQCTCVQSKKVVRTYSTSSKKKLFESMSHGKEVRTAARYSAAS